MALNPFILLPSWVCPQAISMRGCAWLTDANVEKVCKTLQHLE